MLWRDGPAVTLWRDVLIIWIPAMLVAPDLIWVWYKWYWDNLWTFFWKNLHFENTKKVFVVFCITAWPGAHLGWKKWVGKCPLLKLPIGGQLPRVKKIHISRLFYDIKIHKKAEIWIFLGYFISPQFVCLSIS